VDVPRALGSACSANESVAGVGHNAPQTTSPEEARTSTVSFWPSLYLRQIGSATSQVPWSRNSSVSGSLRGPSRRAPGCGAPWPAGRLFGHAGDMPVPVALTSSTFFQRRAVKRHQLSITGSERYFGLHFLTCSNVPSFLSRRSLWHSSPSCTWRL